MKRVNFEPDAGKAQTGLSKDELVQQMMDGHFPEPVELDRDVVDRTGGDAPSDDELVERVVEALKTVYDPEIPVNIYDLGLIYRVEIKPGCFAEIDMTLTAPGCPVAQTFPGMVEATVKLVPGIADAVVELVWEPPWNQALINEAARLELGLI